MQRDVRLVVVIVLSCILFLVSASDLHDEEASTDAVVAPNILQITVEALAIVTSFFKF